jgi:hypothetical protein
LAECEATDTEKGDRVWVTALVTNSLINSRASSITDPW